MYEHTCYIHCLKTLIIILALVYNNILYLVYVHEARLFWVSGILICHSEVINLWFDFCTPSKHNCVFILALLVRVNCGTSCEIWVLLLNSDDSFCGILVNDTVSSRGMCCLNCRPSNSILSWRQYPTPIHLPCHADYMMS